MQLDQIYGRMIDGPTVRQVFAVRQNFWH